jgi:hypothetical protein
MCQIARLLPPAYWGVYAEHPRLRELLNSTGNAEGMEDDFQRFQQESIQ